MKKKKFANVLFTIFLVAGLILLVFGVSGATGKLALLSNSTFGDTNIESNDNTAGYGQINVCTFQCSATGTLNALSLYCFANAGSPMVNAVVYSDNNGAPGSLLGQGTSMSAPASFGWLQLGGLSISVTSGTYYWLGFWVGGSGYGDVISYANTQGSTTNKMAYLFWQYSSAPASFGTPNGYAAWMASIYATVTTSPTPTPITTPPPGRAYVTLSVVGSGTISLAYGAGPPDSVLDTTSVTATYTVPVGTTVEFLYNAGTNYVFDHWVLNGVTQTGLANAQPFYYTVTSNNQEVTMQVVFTSTTITPTPTPTPTPPNTYTYDIIAVLGGGMSAISGLALYFVNVGKTLLK